LRGGALNGTVIDMETVTLSPEFQVVIPKSIRNALQLAPGDKMHVICYSNRVQIIPSRSMKSMRGFLLRLDTQADTGIDRESDLDVPLLQKPYEPNVLLDAVREVLDTELCAAN
jgi:AbrB family looped-hinge helix DNA binding protein